MLQSSTPFGSGVIINGVSYGSQSVVIRNGRVVTPKSSASKDKPPTSYTIIIQSGADITMEDDQAVNVRSIEVKGDVEGGINTQSSSIRVEGSVAGNVSTMSGSVNVGGTAGSRSVRRSTGTSRNIVVQDGCQQQ